VTELTPSGPLKVGKRNCLALKIFGILVAVAEGPIAIGALVVIVLSILKVLWWG
jgi:hypothetical protein